MLLEFLPISGCIAFSAGEISKTPSPMASATDYRDALSEIVQDETIAGIFGRSVFACNLSFLLVADEKWTKINLIPLFTKHANVDNYQAVWDGFLYENLSPPVAELMEDAFLEAVTRIKECFIG